MLSGYRNLQNRTILDSLERSAERVIAFPNLTAMEDAILQQNMVGLSTMYAMWSCGGRAGLLRRPAAGRRQHGLGIRVPPLPDRPESPLSGADPDVLYPLLLSGVSPRPRARGRRGPQIGA